MTVPAARLPARVLGGLLAVVLAPVAAARRGRALHPEGVTLRGTLQLDEGWDGTPQHGAYRGPALVRVSRAAGLRPGLPDVPGVAVRWVVDGDRRDLLLAGSGAGPLGRFLLVPRRSPWGGPFSTLMPFRTPHGPLLLGAVPGGSSTGDTRSARLRVDLVLVAATPRGAWRTCGSLVADERADDTDPRFDPVRHAPAETYAWAAALRLPAYAAARRHGRARRDRQRPSRTAQRSHGGMTSHWRRRVRKARPNRTTH